MRRIRTSRPGVTWLQGPGPTDLWTWSQDAGGIVKQELTFFGRTVLMEHGKLMTGLCHEGARGGYVGETGLIAIDSKLDEVTLNAAYLVLDAMPDAARNEGSAAIKKQILDELAARGLPEPKPKPRDPLTEPTGDIKIPNLQTGDLKIPAAQTGGGMKIPNAQTGGASKIDDAKTDPDGSKDPNRSR